jgi:hypothetical protein
MRVNDMNAVQSVEKQYHSEREMFIKGDGKDNSINLGRQQNWIIKFIEHDSPLLGIYHIHELCLHSYEIINDD